MKRRETLICNRWRCFYRRYELPVGFLLAMAVFGAILCLVGWLK